MSRSLWKNFKNSSIKKHYKTNMLKCWCRNSVILSSEIGKLVYVYNGKIFKKFMITREKIGFKYGDFSGTRTYGTSKKQKSIKGVKKIK